MGAEGESEKHHLLNLDKYSCSKAKKKYLQKIMESGVSRIYADASSFPKLSVSRVVLNHKKLKR